MRLVDFFRELKHVLSRCHAQLCDLSGLQGPGELEERLRVRELSGELAWNVVLFKKYKQVYQKLFRQPEPGAGADPWFAFGWRLFIVSKDRLLPEFPDLISATYAVICSLNILLAHVPPARLWHPLNSQEAYPVRTSAGGMDTLGNLTKLLKLSPEQHAEAVELMGKVDDLLGQIFAADESVERCIPPLESVIATGCNSYNGLMKPGAAERHLAHLDQVYEKSLAHHGDIDERLIALDSYEPQVGNPGQMTPALKKVRGPKVAANLSNHSSGLLFSPMKRSGPPGTPVTEAMKATQWLANQTKDYVALAEAATYAGAPEALERVLPAFSGGRRASLLGQIHAYVLAQAEMVLPAPAAHGVQAAKRRQEGVALYYSILRAMLEAEKRRKGDAHLEGMLMNKKLHLSLIAFAFELVAAAYKIMSLTFPTVLERLGTCAFDLCKVIEPLVRPDTGLDIPKDLLRHLSAIEERSLEVLSWKPGSSLYRYLSDARGQSPEAQPDGAPGAAPPKSPSKNSAFSVYRNLPSAYGSPSPSGADLSLAEAVLEEFFKKLLKLAKIRLSELCERLDREVSFLDRSQGKKVTCLVVESQGYAIAEKIVYHQTRLLYNRHFDQVLLAIVYGVCKVNKLSVQFKDIVSHYTKQPQCTQEVYRTIVLEQVIPERGDGDWKVLQRGDVIAFYNKVFIPLMKEDLITVAKTLNDPEQLPGLAGGSAFSTPTKKRPAEGQYAGLPPAYKRSPQKIAEKVYVSPLRKSQEYWLSKPEEGSLYAFVGEATHAYQSPAKSLLAINTSLHADQAGVTAALALDAAKTAAATLSGRGASPGGRRSPGRGG